MKTLIIALNSKYIHSSLAVWYLKASCGPECSNVKVLEHTINEDPASVLASIYREKPDVVALSCYIWNIRYVLGLVSNLKKVLPGLVIILGGPEVSFDSEQMLETNSEIDYIIAGEGEAGFPKLLQYLKGNEGADILKNIGGLCFRDSDGTSLNALVSAENLDSIPSPYTVEMLEALGNRIVYYESSRGCPFKCSYCLSSTFDGVRFFSMERVRRELTMLFYSGVRQVKFVDRTFNCHRGRAIEIFHHIIGLYHLYFREKGEEPEINFHFEAAADLFDEETLGLLASAPAGLIQLEIGVQTVNEAALVAVNRKTDTASVSKNVGRLLAAYNVHLHLDLIAGLPFEDFASFRNSFNVVYRLGPHQLQLGFLKLLKGTQIRRQADEYSYVFADSPPYELFSNKFLGYDELLVLKGVEELLDRYYNSGRFGNALLYLINYFESPFDFYLGFHRYILLNNLLSLPTALKELYGLLLEYGSTVGDINTEALKEFLRLDFLCSDSSGSLPPKLYRPEPPAFRDSCFSFLKREENIKNLLPGLCGLPAKEIFKKVHFELFNLDFTQDAACFDSEKRTVVLFDYTRRNRVNGLFNHNLLDKFSF